VYHLRVEAIIVHVHLQPETDLMEVALAVHRMRARFGARKRRQEQGSQDRDVCDNDQQLDQSETRPSRASHMPRKLPAHNPAALVRGNAQPLSVGVVALKKKTHILVAPAVEQALDSHSVDMAVAE